METAVWCLSSNVSTTACNQVEHESQNAISGNLQVIGTLIATCPQPRSIDVPHKNYCSDARDGDPHQAFIRALDAMEDWHHHSETVFEQMAIAAESLGWPDSMVQESKSQLIQAAHAQTQMLEQMIDAWRARMEGQRQLRGNETSTTADPARDVETNVVPAPLWFQATIAWQKNWADAMLVWTPEAGRQDNEREGLRP